MEFSDVNRRGFLKHTATAAAVGAGLSAGSLSAAALSKAEVEQWQSRVGSRFQVGDAELVLQSVDAADHSADAARPRNLRTHSIAMLFVLQGGAIDAQQPCLKHSGQELHLTPVVAPRGKNGSFFEAILN